MEEKKEKEKNAKEESFSKLKKNVEEEINKIEEEKVKRENTDYLYRLVDIYKDLGEIQMQKEEENMRYNNYEGYGEYSEGSYGRRGVPGSGRGRYSEGSYGRRGVPGTGRGRYRGEEMMEDMMYHYGNYNEGREQYGADDETMKSFKYMLKSFKDYYKHLKQEASSQQEVKMLEDVAREISEM